MQINRAQIQINKSNKLTNELIYCNNYILQQLYIATIIYCNNYILQQLDRNLRVTQKYERNVS